MYTKLTLDNKLCLCIIQVWLLEGEPNIASVHILIRELYTIDMKFRNTIREMAYPVMANFILDL